MFSRFRGRNKAAASASGSGSVVDRSDSNENVTTHADGTQHDIDELPQATSTFKGLVPVMACGAGLFSDGYINNVSCAPAWPQPRPGLGIAS
jgi:hypothetical protein